MLFNIFPFKIKILFLMTVPYLILYMCYTKMTYLKKNVKEERYLMVYNRIPKSGSTFLMQIICKMSYVNDYNVVYLNTTFKPNELTPMDQVLLAKNITTWIPEKSFVYHGHFNYFDIERLSSKGDERTLVYFNVLREPMSRFISHYYFLRFGDDYRPHIKRLYMGDNKTLDECVAKNGSGCQPELLWIQIPYFCGHFSFCRQPGNQLALRHAKMNLINKYFLVGTTERLKDFVELLEHSFPTLFEGAMTIFNKAVNSSEFSKRKTINKTFPTSITIEILKSNPIYLMEKEFYDFASEIFEDFYRIYAKHLHKNLDLGKVSQKI